MTWPEKLAIWDDAQPAVSVIIRCAEEGTISDNHKPLRSIFILQGAAGRTGDNQPPLCQEVHKDFLLLFIPKIQTVENTTWADIRSDNRLSLIVVVKNVMEAALSRETMTLDTVLY